MRLTNSYRIIFLYERYQKIVSACSLLGLLFGIFMLAHFSMLLASSLHISGTTALFRHPEGPWWLACVAVSMPLLFYAGVMGMGCISGLYLVFQGDMQWADLNGYITQSKFPEHWFEQKPWF